MLSVGWDEVIHMRRGLAVGSIALALSFAVLWSTSPSADADWVMGDIARVADALGLQPTYDGKYDLSEILLEVLARLGVEWRDGCHVEFNNTVDVYRGNCATLQVSTLSGADCSIEVVLPSGTVSTASGLSTQTADASGNVIWTWLVRGNTGPGTGTICVTATMPGGESCTAEMEWTVREK